MEVYAVALALLLVGVHHWLALRLRHARAYLDLAFRGLVLASMPVVLVLDWPRDGESLLGISDAGLCLGTLIGSFYLYELVAFGSRMRWHVTLHHATYVVATVVGMRVGYYRAITVVMASILATYICQPLMRISTHPSLPVWDRRLRPLSLIPDAVGLGFLIMMGSHLWALSPAHVIFYGAMLALTTTLHVVYLLANQTRAHPEPVRSVRRLHARSSVATSPRDAG